MNDDIFFGGKTVLLVEDEVFAAKMISKQLMALGIQDVLFAASLDEAREHLDAEAIDIALLDVNLRKGETTIELGWSLSAENVPVVFFSGFNAQEMAHATRGHEFMEKPVSLPRLKASMLRAMLRAPSFAPTMARTKMAGQEARQSG